MDFKCTKCNYPDENNTLQLVVEDGIVHTFNIDADGTLEHYNSDGMGQTIYLNCPVCGVKYETEDYNMGLEEEFVLKRYYFDKNGYTKSIRVNANDLKFNMEDK